MKRAEMPEYRSWTSMRFRCLSSRCPAFKHYGGRGITICERWDDFAAFLTDMGPRPSPKHSLDRINNDGNYEPGNCRWATDSEQARNKRSNQLVIVDGRRVSVAEACEIRGLKRVTVDARILRGDSPQKAVDRPMHLRLVPIPKRCRFGHLLDKDTLYFYPRKTKFGGVTWQCRACQRERKRTERTGVRDNLEAVLESVRLQSINEGSL